MPCMHVCAVIAHLQALQQAATLHINISTAKPVIGCLVADLTT
jgi:hypothetical protein